MMEKNIALFITDVLRHKVLAAMLFAVISLLFLFTGTLWPKVYSASTVLSVDETSLISSLGRGQGMAGAGRGQEPFDRGAAAEQVLFKREVMLKILEHGGWLKSNPTAVEQEQIMKGIQGRTTVTGGKTFIAFSYKDSDPERTYGIINKMTELFIEEYSKLEIAESQEKLEFINQQVESYRAKLVASEGKLEEFKSANPDIREGSERQIGNRIDELGSDIDEAKLELRELEKKRDSLQAKLSGEAEIGASTAREKEYLDRLSTLRSKLDEYRLVYTDSHPDVVNVKDQITELEQAITNHKLVGIEGNVSVTGAEYSSLYQELRSQLSETGTEIDTIGTRIQETIALRELEIGKSKRINRMEAVLANLTRDYETNEGVYDNLLLQRENAQVEHDEKLKSLTLKVLEPAVAPISPVGVQFMHFALGGLLFGLAVPLGLIYLKSALDPRVRLADTLMEDLSLPVLGAIPTYMSPGERRKNFAAVAMMYGMVIVTLATYGVVGYMKYTGEL